MSLVDIISYVVAASLAISRILASTQPFWKLVPTKIATFLPSLVAMLPVLADKVGAATSSLDLVNAFIVAGALLLPGAGISAAEEKKE